MFKDKYNPWTSFVSAAALNRIYNRYKSEGGYKLFPEVNESQKKMARFSKRRRTNAGYKRRRKFRRGGGRLLRKIKRINRTLARKGVFNIETKYLRTGGTYFANLPDPTSGVSNATNLMGTLTRGEDFDEMQGGKIFVKNIRLQYMLRAPSTMAGDVVVRIMVVRDKQPASPSTVPLLQQLFDFYIPNKPTSQSEADLNIMLWRWTNSNTAGRFQILYNKMHIVTPAADNSYHKNIFYKKTIRINKPWYTDATEAQTNDARKGPGQLYLVYFSNSMDGANLGPFLNAAWRASYTDC